VPGEEVAAVVQELSNHIRLTRQEPGCLVFEVTQSREIPGRFDVYEEFESRVAFEAHQMRVKNSIWAQVSENATRHYEIVDGN